MSQKGKGWRQQRARYMDLKIRVLRDEYQATLEAWHGRYHNDKALFCTMMLRLIEECENMKAVKSSYIMVAFNEKFDKDRERLDRIKAFFEEREGGV